MLPRPMIKILLVCTPDDDLEWGSRWAYWMKEGSWERSQRFLKQKSTLILQLALDCSERGFSRKEEVLRGLPMGSVLRGLPRGGVSLRGLPKGGVSLRGLPNELKP